MTPQEIRLCQESWSRVVPIAEDAAGLFYKNLFEVDKYEILNVKPTAVMMEGSVIHGSLQQRYKE